MTTFGIFAYPWDFEPETLERRLTSLAAMGLDRLILAALYHDGRQLSPNGPRRVRWIRGGRAYVPVAHGRYPAGLAPERTDAAVSFAEITAAARSAGLAVEAWTVSLHRDDLVAVTDPLPARIRNVFGEEHLAWLCPNSTDSRSYLRAHLADLARAEVDAVVLEGAHFPLLAHAFHHESPFDWLGELDAWLLSLCFCQDCRDTTQAAHTVRAQLERTLSDGRRRPLPGLDELDDELRAQASRRMRAVTTMIEHVAPELPIRYADQAVIAGPIFRTGRAGPAPAAERGWQFGLDYASISRPARSVVALGYLSEPSELRAHLEAYLSLGVPPEKLDIALRPGPIDTADAAGLVGKIRLARELGSGSVDFYNLAFASSRDLRTMADAIAQAL